jgi:NAD-dependent DNA ligase
VKRQQLLSPFGEVSNACALSEEQAKVELEHLSASLLYHDWLYYNGAGGTEEDALSDYEFDLLERRQQQVEQAFPRLKGLFPSRSDRVGAAPLLDDVVVTEEEHGQQLATTAEEETSSSSSSSSLLASVVVASKTKKKAPKKKKMMSKKKEAITAAAAAAHLSPLMSLDNALSLTEVLVKTRNA